jgi:PadR family transcriptional regulator, regulatory protein PadR
MHVSQKSLEHESLPENKFQCCKRPGLGHPCTCAIGNFSRFIEPVVLRIIKEKKQSYGYEIAESLDLYALTDAIIERAALYRTLRTLEANGHVISTWETGVGPARRNYSLTPSGELHLRDWANFLRELGEAMIQYSLDVQQSSDMNESNTKAGFNCE